MNLQRFTLQSVVGVLMYAHPVEFVRYHAALLAQYPESYKIEISTVTRLFPDAFCAETQNRSYIFLMNTFYGLIYGQKGMGRYNLIGIFKISNICIS